MRDQTRLPLPRHRLRLADVFWPSYAWLTVKESRTILPLLNSGLNESLRRPSLRIIAFPHPTQRRSNFWKGEKDSFAFHSHLFVQRRPLVTMKFMKYAIAACKCRFDERGLAGAVASGSGCWMWSVEWEREPRS
jgi:hypothetical protein